LIVYAIMYVSRTHTVCCSLALRPCVHSYQCTRLMLPFMCLCGLRYLSVRQCLHIGAL